MVKQVWGATETGPAARVGTRMMHLGVAALLARKGVKTTVNQGIPVKYTWRKVGPGGGAANSFRLQPFANQDFFQEQDDYMKLRNFSFNVYKEDWSGYGDSTSRPRGKETERQNAARHLWAGAYPGANMKHYRIKGREGAEELMTEQLRHYKEQGMEMILQSLSRAMLQDFVKVMGRSSTWKQAIDTAGKNIGRYRPGQKHFEMGDAPPLLRNKLKYVKTRRGGLPVIGADSTEEAELYIMNAFMKEKIEFDLKGKEIDVNTGMIVAGRRGIKRGVSQRLDISKKYQADIFKEINKFLMTSKNKIQWEKNVGLWYNKIEGYDIGEQSLEQRFLTEWHTTQNRYNMESIKDLEDLKKFVSIISKKAQKFTVSKTTTPRKGPLWPNTTLTEDVPMEKPMRKGDVAQFGRRLRQLKGKSYIFTQPLGRDGRAIILVQEIDDIPTFTVGYIPGTNLPLGAAVVKSLIGDQKESRMWSELRYMAERGYASYKNEALRITESVSTSYFYYGAMRYGDLTTTTTMVAPRILAKATKDWIDDACGHWWSDASWDKVFDPNQMKGFGFAQWFRYWIELSKKAAFQIDNRTGTPGWGQWLKNTVTPKYIRGVEGGRRPKNLTPGRRMMPYDPPAAGGPRAWHSPLYARPFFIQDNWGKKMAASREKGDLQRFIAEKRRLEEGLPEDDRVPGWSPTLRGFRHNS